jgi:hypothetical protein
MVLEFKKFEGDKGLLEKKLKKKLKNEMKKEGSDAGTTCQAAT